MVQNISRELDTSYPGGGKCRVWTDLLHFPPPCHGNGLHLCVLYLYHLPRDRGPIGAPITPSPSDWGPILAVLRGPIRGPPESGGPRMGPFLVRWRVRRNPAGPGLQQFIVQKCAPNMARCTLAALGANRGGLLLLIGRVPLAPIRRVRYS
jgi:hypothetical protein